ncbi:putative peroxisomal-coenzyme A synthetase [Fusarium oxysporum f. sp. raphani]|uniref:Putative peroxisomal-coenzyme A synthetase n=1 Tax=Fusarium oxysporum f. sp. raphani TaxID=96318 RepID=A0A8J5QDG0_FUSOX|nr:putative peroxisomal-coenzyme A synthetase [Fusarium oxysporum f. sp. raphani]
MAVKQSQQFRSLVALNLDRAELLAAIPTSQQHSIFSLYTLCHLLEELPGSWPVFQLIKTYTRLYTQLPEDAKTNSNHELSSLIEQTSALVKSSYTSFAQFIGYDDKPALRAPTDEDVITHRELRQFVDNFQLPADASDKKPVVSIALPNGPLLAATCIAVTTYYTASPINPAAGAEQFRADILQARADFILTTKDEYEKLQLDARWVSDNNIQIFIMDWTRDEGISLRTVDGEAVPTGSTQRVANKADDIGLILFTSGTSGTKKVVPLTAHSIVAGVAFVIESWGLTATDICLNMMPLYHVGGLVRNIFAPIFSGGSTVCCPSFDANLFWDVAETIQPTWYYASPSMHSIIIAEATARPKALRKSRIRLACNAAGGLLPSLAYQLRDTFNCVVLPSYGMTECMPISTPPLDYRLDREGTSGISTGPELTILDWSEQNVTNGTVGRICVRGEPVFPGYLKPDGTYDKSPFNEHGWFDTGDLGYMDDDGYLYITGRSKEVINRGGELISPFEVENAIMTASRASESAIYGRVSQALAFSASHDVLQEVVAIVLVTPPNVPRVDMRTLHGALKSSLQQAKWPVLITYMNDVPKNNNKVLRIKLGQRLGLPSVSDDTPYMSRHWDAVCPPADTPLSEAIQCSPCSVDYTKLASHIQTIVPDLDVFCLPSTHDGSPEAVLAPKAEATVDSDIASSIRHQLASIIDNYMIPTEIHLMPRPFQKDSSGNIDVEVLHAELEQLQMASMNELAASTEGLVTKAFAEVLSIPPADIPRDADFFSLGGDSLRAGRLLSTLRAEFSISLPITAVFNGGTVTSIAAHIDKMLHSKTDVSDQPSAIVGCTETCSSTNPFLMILQLFPLVIFYPLRRAVQWTIFFVTLAHSQKLPTNHSLPGRFLNLTVSMLIARIIMGFVSPIVGIICKWLIIGRYRAGLYPMWGMYHTRWWLVQKIVAICGKGFFDANEMTERIYCRLMGAKIGRNVKLEGAALGEWDLIEVGDDCNLTKCICRPFAAEGNTSMYLGRITIGSNCSVGMSSIVAPGTNMPPDTCLGFNSSSWEMQDASEEYRDQLPSEKPKPHWVLNLLFTMPLKLIGLFLSAVPWMAGLVGMVTTQGQTVNHKAPLRSSVDWFTQPNRIAYHYLALALGCLFGPFFLFGFVILVKSVLDCIFGKLKANSRNTVDIWRANLIKMLLPEGKLHRMTSLFGQHYEATSIALRMLGAKIGERVYWPGTGPSIGDYHLIDVGNDVVFGSRSHLVTSDGIGSEKVTIQDRAMIADRVCLLPGVTVGERTTMGSGALTKRNGNYVSDGTYVGSKAGDAVCLSTGSDTKVSRSHIRNMQSEDTLTNEKERPDTQPSITSGSDTEGSDGKGDWAQHLSPFGRAFYLKLAPYHVLGPFAIFCYSGFFTVFTAVYWDVPSVSSIQFVGIMFRSSFPRGMNVWFDLVAIFLTMLAGIAVLSTIQSVLALVIIIGSKWLLMGRRTAGNYDWDKSPYCQRWQIFLGIERLRRHCYKGNGILNLLTGTHWMVIYFKLMGAKIGKDCALFVNGTPSLMFTEPDLITLGDRVVVDDASVVAHINTRGKFDLNRVEIGDRCVLRTGSRLLSGAQMKSDSCLLEHTLIMGGDIVEERRTMQGWPAEELKNILIGISVLTFSTVVFFALHTSPHLPFRPNNIQNSWVPSDPPSWPPQPAESSRYTDRLVNYKPEHPNFSEVQPIETKRLAVLLPTFDGHFPQVLRYFQSVKCLCVDHDKVDWHIIVSNSAEVEGLTQLLSTLDPCNQTFSRWKTPKDNVPGKNPSFNIVNLYDILPARLRTDLTPEDTSALLKKFDKYAYQSLKKMSAADHFDYDFAMWLDSEAIFVAPGEIRNIFEGHMRNPIVWRSRMSFQDREKFLMSKAAATLGRSINSFGDQLWLLESLQWIIEKPIWNDMVSSVEMAHGGNFWDIWIENSYPFELLVYYLHIIARKMETVNSIFSNYRILETERELIRFGLAESISAMEGRRGTGFMERLPHLITKPHSVLAPNLVAFCRSYSLRALRMDNVENFEDSALDSFLIDGDIKMLVSGAPDIHKWWDDRIKNGDAINNTEASYS